MLHGRTREIDFDPQDWAAPRIGAADTQFRKVGEKKWEVL
jgi:hypothetical protein